VEDRLGEMEIVVFPKVLEKYSYFLTPDSPIAVYGELSLSEDAPPKLLAMKIEPLQANYTPQAAAQSEARKPQTPPNESRSAPKALYLKVESLECEACRRVITILEIFEGNLPVVFYDASKQKYVKAVGRSTVIQPTMLSLIKQILGDSAVVLK
jgi:DNA polymerase-3 subunit alpha